MALACQLRLVVAGIYLEQGVAGLHVATLGVEQFLDDAVDARPHFGRADGFDPPGQIHVQVDRLAANGHHEHLHRSDGDGSRIVPVTTSRQCERPDAQGIQHDTTDIAAYLRHPLLPGGRTRGLALPPPCAGVKGPTWTAYSWDSLWVDTLRARWGAPD